MRKFILAGGFMLVLLSILLHPKPESLLETETLPVESRNIEHNLTEKKTKTSIRVTKEPTGYSFEYCIKYP